MKGVPAWTAFVPHHYRNSDYMPILGLTLIPTSMDEVSDVAVLDMATIKGRQPEFESYLTISNSLGAALPQLGQILILAVN